MIQCARHIPGKRRATAFCCAAATLLYVASANVAALAQDLTPRTYWPAPKGTRLLIFGYAYQTGDIVTDPSIPLTGVDSKIDSAVIAYQQTLNFFGRTGNFQLEVPYVDGTTTGLVSNEPGRRDVAGFGDIAATVTINLIGAPSMSPVEFQELRQSPRPILGTSIKIVAPTGEYEKDKLINIGTNRWAVRFRLGYIRPLTARWLLEMSAGAWFFGDNEEFLGMTRKQDPIAALNFHLVRRFKPGLWGSLDFNYYLGGHSTVGDVRRADLQRNSRIGLSFAYPFNRKHAIKLGISEGVVTESGGDFRSINLNYVYRIR
ncbi:MAG: transporter [Gammaproteobacteria bacterium]|nr:transporter [Gammaproteobacteria bacterium]